MQELGLAPLLASALVAVVFSAIYTVIVHIVIDGHPSQPYTVFLTVGGVAGTLLAALAAVPVEYLLVIGGLFLVTGLPQIGLAMWRNLQRERKAAQHVTELIEKNLRG